MKPWPHQERAMTQIREALSKRIHSCVVAPPGAGKSWIMRETTREQIAAGKRIAIFIHRQALMDQTIELFQKEEIPFGVVASKYGEFEDPYQPVQLCSIQTVYRRLGTTNVNIPRADVVLVDEAHQQTETMAKSIFFGCDHFIGYDKQQATIIGFSATPVDLSGVYRKLIYAGHYTELRACRAHLPVHTFGCNPPDLSDLKTNKSGDYSSKKIAERMKVHVIFADVHEQWKRHNPDGLPAILFAPGVGESKFFVTHFAAQGVCTAHIDGEQCYWTEWVTQNGTRTLVKKSAETTTDIRKMLMERSREGYFKVICNRFVLREAIDMPWLYHGILATSFGSIASYLQSVGRIQRYFPEYDKKLITDHGGNYDRHGSPNDNRQWKIGDTANSIAKEIFQKKQSTPGNEAEALCCPKCGGYRMRGKQCPYCGWQHVKSVRFVRQLNGQLVRKVGRLVKYKRPKDANDIYRSALYAAESMGQSVKQAMIIFQSRTKKKGLDLKLSDVTQYAVPPWDSFEARLAVSDLYPRIRSRYPARAKHGR